jgi:flagellar hook-associated protein 1 FlgK
MGFHGLNIGLSSLIAQRRALEVTGHNLANVGTDGYSRQRVEMISDSGPITPALWSRYQGAGNGVQSGSITRMRDQFLELRGYQEHAANTNVAAVASTYERIEALFAEPSDTALGAQLADYWAGWGDVANRPDDPAARSQLIERATTLALNLGRMDNDLATMRQQTIDQLQAVVLDVNVTAARIAELNSTIQNAVNSGLNASDLMDQRDLLISQLAEQVGVTVRPGEAGAMDVYLGGTALVRAATAQSLEVTVGTTVGIAWTKDGLPAEVSGTAGGMLESVNVVIPAYRQHLSDIAAKLQDETNQLHVNGYGLDDSTGLDFFVDDPGSLIAVNPDLVADPRKIAASAIDPDDGDPTTPDAYDGEIAARLAKSHQTEDMYREVVVALGVEAQSANRRVEIQQSITDQVDKLRQAESGVNLDEEMTNLVMYQHAYNAAARFVSVIDEVLDTLINATG